MPVSTTSRCPCSTRRAISASTAAAFRLRDAPRTSGMTQKLHEKLQPSCTLTNARTRSTRASACTQAIAPTSPATDAGVASLLFATTTTLSGSPANAPPARFAPQPVTYTRRWVRAARAASLRDFATASFVTQHVLTTATSAPDASSSWPSASRRSRTSWASTCETLQPRKRTLNVATREMLRDFALQQVGGPAPVGSSCDGLPAGAGRPVSLEIAGHDGAARMDARQERLDDVERDVCERDVDLGELVREPVGAECRHLDAVHLRVRGRRLDSGLVEVDRGNGHEAELRGRDREHARAAADVEQRPRPQRLQELERQARRRMRAGAEGTSGIDDDRVLAEARFP